MRSSATGRAVMIPSTHSSISVCHVAGVSSAFPLIHVCHA
jgi:hypothetical protein